jgi:hypothetical protein
MKKLGIVTGLMGLLATAAPVGAQMWFFPDYALPSANGAPSTWLAATYGRGLNDASGKTDAFGGAVGRTTEKASFMGAVGQARSDGEGELTVGGSVGFDVMQRENSVVSVQGGIGWFSSDLVSETLTALRFPIGVAWKGAFQSPEAMITPWIMPKVNIARLSAGDTSETETDFGAAGGASFTFPNGFGIHTAVDVLLANSTMWYFGIGAHYVLGGGGGGA